MNNQLIKNLITLNEWLVSHEKKITLHLIGGYALYLRGIENRYTEDIDNINEIVDDEIINKIQEIGTETDSPNWFDFAATSIILPENYQLRLSREKGFSHIAIYTLSKEDLIALKIGAYYTRKEITIRDFADIIAILPTESELDYGIDFVLKNYGKNLPRKFLSTLSAELKAIRQEITDALRR